MTDNSSVIADNILETGIRLVEVRIRNFRSLKSINVKLERVTVLIGENNAGKTSFLEAMYAAISGVRIGLSVDDIFLFPEESSAPRDRDIIIDILIRPTDDSGKIINNFPLGSYWTELFGKGISLDVEDRDFVGIRTKLKWNLYDGEYHVERSFLLEWLEDSSKIELAKVNSTLGVSPSLIDIISLFYLDAKRDIVDDLGRQKSVWGRITSDLGLSDETVKEIEEALSNLNLTMVEKSQVLKHLTGDLQVLNNLVAGEDEGVEVSPIARSLRDLSKGIGINFTTRGSQTFPLSKHGMGTRSLASVLVFRAFVSWRIKQAGKNKIHPTLALEEPEAHLHPQAQRAIISQIDKIPGQIIISTHSPYVVSQVSINSIRHFRKQGPETIVSSVDTTSLEKDDVEKINRMVMHTKGEILYARAIIMAEGVSEESALPVYAEHKWGYNHHTCGVSFIGVLSDKNYLPFLRMAIGCNIPWYILADGEDLAIKELLKQLEKVGITDITAVNNIFILPDGNNYEKYLVSQKYEDAICKMLDDHHKSEDYLGSYIKEMHGKIKKGGSKRDYESEGGRQRALEDILLHDRVKYAKPLANSIINLLEPDRQVPTIIDKLFSIVENDTQINPPRGA